MSMPAHGFPARMILTGSLAGLSACVPADPATEPAPPPPDYLQADVTLMGGDLVLVHASARGGPPQGAAAEAYARCVAAGYADDHGASYLRHVRTLTDKEGGVWQADAVYSVTAAEPDGLMTERAADAVAGCGVQGIPTQLAAGA